MLGSSEMKSLFDQSFSGLEEKKEECIKRFNSAVEHINDWGLVLGPFMFAIKPAIDFLGEKLNELVKLVETAVKHHTPVVSLILQSFDWVNSIQRPVNDLTYTEKHLPYYWKGGASDAYQRKTKTQNSAIGAVANKADQVSRWLVEIAKYNIEYMTELAKMVTGFLGAFVSAAIEASTVVHIPFAVSDLAGAIGDLVTKSLDNLVGIAKRFVEAVSKVRDLQSIMTDQNIPKGHWPQAVEG